MENLTSKIVEREGKLFVIDPWTNHFTKPIKFRLAWPTGIFAKDFQHLVDQNVTCYSAGHYRLPDGMLIRLEYGHETKPDPIHSEQRPIPKSPGCHEYRNGRWVK